MGQLKGFLWEQKLQSHRDWTPRMTVACVRAKEENKDHKYTLNVLFCQQSRWTFMCDPVFYYSCLLCVCRSWISPFRAGLLFYCEFIAKYSWNKSYTVNINTNKCMKRVQENTWLRCFSLAEMQFYFLNEADIFFWITALWKNENNRVVFVRAFGNQPTAFSVANPRLSLLDFFKTAEYPTRLYKT